MEVEYDKIADQYTKGDLYESPERKFFIYPAWIKECGDLKHKKVLDLGCGAGLSSRLLAENGARVTGVDISEKMLEKSIRKEEEQNYGITYIQADAENMPELEEKFDIITPSLLLHYASTIDGLGNYIANIAKNLKVGGHMVALNMDLDNPVRPYVKRYPTSAEWLDEPFVEGSRIKVSVHGSGGGVLCDFTIYFWSRKTYEDLFEKNGFRDVQWIKPNPDEFTGFFSDPNEIRRRNIVAIIKAVKK